ncbi:MAG: signal recognition particle receptor subunit alpha [Thermoproteota archaeon]
MESIASTISNALRKFVNKAYVEEEDVQELVRELQRALLKADVPVELVLKFSETVKSKAKQKVLGISTRELAVNAVYEELTKLIGENPVEIKITSKPSKWLFVGIQGYGKTTTVAKVAYYYKKLGYNVCVVCADTYRPAAFDQLKQLLKDQDVPVFGSEFEKNPIKIFASAIKEIEEKNLNPDLILIDTAGRHKDEENLLKELNELVRAINPEAVFLVLDASIGQRARTQAEAFNKVAKVGYIILTKMDSSAKGGGALAAVSATNAKVAFVGTGEKISDLEKFVPVEYASNLLGMPDLKSIIKKVSETINIDRAKQISSGKFTIEDFVFQLNELFKSDLYSTVLKMLPGANKLPSNLKEVTEEKARIWLSIINSMNKEERQDPSIINSSRIRRIARGSGRSEKEVKELLEQYEKSKKMIKRMRGYRGLFPIDKKIGRS